jgi:hypothetical protein
MTSTRELLKQFVDGAPLTPTDMEILLGANLIRRDGDTTRVTTAGSTLLRSMAPEHLPPYWPPAEAEPPINIAAVIGCDSAMNQSQEARNVAPIGPPQPEYAAAQEAQNQQARNGLDMWKNSGTLREHPLGKLLGRAPSVSESDPNGKAQHETGAKLDAGKPRLGLVLGAFANALVEVGKVGTYGAQKYTDNGWLDVPKGKARYTDALLRHVLAETNETHDPDTLLLHAAHAAWNALARLELVMRKRGEGE